MAVTPIIRLLCAALLVYLSFSAAAQRVALTFDDAPTADGPFFTGEERTRRILGHLKDHHVQAAFFVLTSNVTEVTGKRLYSFAEAGHILANHSHTHPWIHEIGVRGYIRDVARADSILEHYPHYEKWFRYPYLDEGRSVSSRDSVRSTLRGIGLSNGYVTVDNYDWYINGLLRNALEQGKKPNMEALREMYTNHILASIEFYDRIAREHLGRSPAHVLLLHENDLAALFLDDLLTLLEDKGWSLVSPREAYRDPIAGHVPDVLFNGQGRVAAIARERGVPARQLVQHSEDEVFLDSLAVKHNVFR